MSDGAKENCDVPLCLYCCPSTTSLFVYSFLAREISSIIGLCIPLPYWVSQTLVWRGSGISLLFHKKQYNGRHLISLTPHPNGTLDKSVLKYIFIHICLSQFLSWCEDTLSFCGMHDINASLIMNLVYDMCKYRGTVGLIHILSLSNLSHQFGSL